MRRGLVALVAGGRHREEVSLAALDKRLQPVISTPNLLVFAGEDLAVVHSQPGAVVIGDMFDPLAETGAPWGSFLRIAEERGGCASIVRAPLTGLPFYWTRLEGGVLGFSHLELASDLLSIQPDIDFLRLSMAYRNLRTARTGLAGVSELLAGTRLRSDGDWVDVDPVWSPWTFAAREAETDPARAPAALAQRAVAAVDQWTASRGELLLELSGGLDSSIIAACLAQTGRRYRAVTVATASADGDERRFARDVAAHTGGELAEVWHEDDAVDLTRAPAKLTPRPAAANILRGFDQAIARVWDRDRSAAYLSGIGGDNVFNYSNSIAPALDAGRRFGIGRHLLRVIGDIARVTNTTVGHVGRAYLRRRMRGPRTTWPLELDFSAPASLPDAPPPHPWLTDAGACPPGKRQHVEALIRISDFLDRPERWYGRDAVAPLLSQPLVELCLSVPSWKWVEGGRDRAAARKAFAPYLPPSVAGRRTKGRLQTMAGQMFARERAKLGPLLLEGRLAAMHLLDRPAIETYLSQSSVDEDFRHFRLMEIADLELWLQAAERAGGR